MRVLIVSDTHGRRAELERALDEAGEIDMFIHLGDVEDDEDYIRESVSCETHIVRGNNDYFSALPQEEEFDIGALHVFITHGHYYYVSMNTERIADEGRDRHADIVMFGHTHRPYLKKKRGVILLNPGSLSYPRQEGRKPGYMIMETDEQGKAHFEQCFLQR